MISKVYNVANPFAVLCALKSQRLIGLSHIRVSAHVGIRSSYSSIRGSYSSYAEVLRFLCVHLKIRSTYVAGPIRHTYVTHVVHTKATWQERRRYVAHTPDTPHVRSG